MAGKESLTILVIIGHWPPQTFIQRLLLGLLARGVHITVACENRPADDWFQNQGADWLRIYSWRGNWLKRLARLISMVVASGLRSFSDTRLFWRSALQQRPLTLSLMYFNRWLPYAGRRWNLVYFPWNFAAGGYLPLFDLGMPVLLSCRGSQVNITPHDPRREDAQNVLSVTFEKATQVHCVSVDIMKEAASFGLDSKKARIIRPAVDPGFFKPGMEKAQTSDSFRILAVGSLIWVKGYEYALLAMRHLVDAGVPVQFEIIGSGPDKQRILFTIADLQLEDHVRLLGNMSSAKVRDRLQQVDAFLLSSLSEGISNAVLEAMACSLPVVSTECGGMSEAIEDGVDGFLVSIRDHRAMADRLELLFKNPGLRQDVGRAARERVFNQFSLDLQVDQFYKLIAQASKVDHIQDF